jgi:hypothetical protein
MSALMPILHGFKIHQQQIHSTDVLTKVPTSSANYGNEIEPTLASPVFFVRLPNKKQSHTSALSLSENCGGVSILFNTGAILLKLNLWKTGYTLFSIVMLKTFSILGKKKLRFGVGYVFLTLRMP